MMLIGIFINFGEEFRFFLVWNWFIWFYLVFKVLGYLEWFLIYKCIKINDRFMYVYIYLFFLFDYIEIRNILK